MPQNRRTLCRIIKAPSTRTPQNRRRRQAPAPEPAAVCSHYRPNRNETQHTRPLLVGRVCVYFEPTALSVGTADPVELGADGGDGDLDEFCQEQDGTLDGIVDQRVQAQGGNDLVDDGVAHGAKEYAQ